MLKRKKQCWALCLFFFGGGGEGGGGGLFGRFLFSFVVGGFL